MDEVIKQRDLEWKIELGEKDAMWRDELRTRYATYWEDSNKKEVDLVRMLERRDKGIQDTFVSRDRAWLNSLHSCSESLRLMTQEQINLRATLESVGKRLCELTKSNAQLLDWAMKVVSGKKKVSLPNINISYYVPCVIVPHDVQDFVIPYTQPIEPQVIPFKPPVQPSQTPNGNPRI